MDHGERDEEDEALVITPADARVLARALLKEILDQAALATGRAFWSTVKMVVAPVLIALLLWLISMKGQPMILAEPMNVTKGG